MLPSLSRPRFSLIAAVVNQQLIRLALEVAAAISHHTYALIPGSLLEGILSLPSTLSPFFLPHLLFLLTTQGCLPFPSACMLALDTSTKKEVVALQLLTPGQVVKCSIEISSTTWQVLVGRGQHR